MAKTEKKAFETHHVRVSGETLTKLKEWMKTNDRSANYAINKALETFLKKPKPLKYGRNREKSKLKNAK